MNWDWILFDADETLFTFDAFAGLQRMFLSYGVAFSANDYAEYQLTNKPLWKDYQEGIISAEQLQLQRFEIWAARLAIPASTLNRAFLNAMAEICAPLPGARDLLDALHGRVKLGIITNGFTALQQIRLERTGFRDYFDLLIISEQFGVPKPDRKIFDHALAQMGQPHPSRDRVLMVGDTLESDILGGINAGLPTCWLNRFGHSAPDHIQPTWQVTSLAELQTMLASPVSAAQ